MANKCLLVVFIYHFARYTYLWLLNLLRQKLYHNGFRYVQHFSSTFSRVGLAKRVGKMTSKFSGPLTV